jgi:enterochelin esterase-like enzyme
MPLLLLSIALAVAAPVGALLLWPRVRGEAGMQVAQRAGLIVGCQLTAVLLAGVALNHEFAFYESWSDLFGQDDQSGSAVERDPSDVARPGYATSVQHGGQRPPAGLERIDGRHRVTHEDVTGPRSGVHASITVITPPGYADPGQVGRHYPVVVFLPGYPGTPSTWLHAIGLQTVMDAEITSGRVPPFIAVLPAMNVAGTLDTECSDVLGGPRVATWLGDDVPAIVSSQVRTLPMGHDWAVTGYSTGGFCAVKLAFAHPRTYGSAAVIAGYYSPEPLGGLAGLFGSDPNTLHENDPMWLLTHGKAPAVRVLAVWSARDPSTAGATRAFLAAARPPLELDELRLNQGGHNTGVWQAVLPRVLTWLGQGLSRS